MQYLKLLFALTVTLITSCTRFETNLHEYEELCNFNDELINGLESEVNNSISGLSELNNFLLVRQLHPSSNSYSVTLFENEISKGTVYYINSEENKVFSLLSPQYVDNVLNAIKSLETINVSDHFTTENVFGFSCYSIEVNSSSSYKSYNFVGMTKNSDLYELVSKIERAAALAYY
ncbi:hypothetical protein HH219_03560 [Pseudoalteromonas sp. NEC-BIFX-2020_015]|uniref:hypothetical protein n=1 Tax=Pseudoalteromonas sp. NEC-BIFX-2020_015 TaxID=2729544 RepID=UPI001461693B|nr:hypothetical protein [Pseudoalteromonas sp. NEC-BIFX-2020_015]NMR24633.1 hypothetical protein [Pseudoalteromonas sp. NEC-BIFX-2020_015]